MLSIDTNLLFFAYVQDRPEHDVAFAWINSISDKPDVAISEFILVEFYRLLRNPAVMSAPLSAREAVAVISAYRTHPLWKLLGFPDHSRRLHAELYERMSSPGIAYRRIYDTRTALALRSQGVTEFATTNLRHFEEFGFSRVWNPLAL